MIYKSQRLVHVKGAAHDYWLWDEKVEGYKPLDEACLGAVIPRFRDLNEKARERARRQYLQSACVIPCGRIPARLPNIRPYRDQWGRRAVPSGETLRAGAIALLSVAELFRDQAVGWDWIADLLGGMWCSKLQAAEPDYWPASSITSRSAKVEQILTLLVQCAVCRKRWNRGSVEIKRRAILDYRCQRGGLPRHIQDFTCAKIQPRGWGHPPLRIPVPYRDTVVLVTGATRKELREAEPYLRQAAVILLNCGEPEGRPRRVRENQADAYRPDILRQVEENREAISLVLTGWQQLSKGWRAREIVERARASFGTPDPRYCQVRLDPQRLNTAIRYQLLLDFLEIQEDMELLSQQELEHYRKAVKEVYDPAPAPVRQVRRVEDPEVFLELMRALVKENPIAPPDTPFSKSSGCLGAWCEISGVQYLVMLEKDFAKAYRKKARQVGDLDCSLFERAQWERELQRILVEAEVIKAASSGYRYRYDLFKNGSRDTTYVLAVPAELLEAS